MSANVHRIAFTGACPWWIGKPEHDHGQWKELPGYATAAEMMKATEMDFRVGKSPIFTYPSKEARKNGQPVLVPGKYAVIRSDTLEPLPGVTVGEDYEPIPFPDMFDIGDMIVSPKEAVAAEVRDAYASHIGGAHWETGGTLYDGRTGWGLIKLEKDMSIAGDWIATFLLLTTTHDGTGALVVKLVNTRVVCCNTYDAAIAEAFRTVRIMHTKNYRLKVAEAQKILNALPEARTKFMQYGNRMVARRINEDTLKALYEHLFPMPKDLPEKPLTARIVDNVIARREALRDAMEAPDLDNIRWTAWGALNAVADLEQHLTKVRNHCDDNTKVARMFERSFNTDDLTRKASEFLEVVTA